MSLSVGDRLGPYEILSQIGVGGMGEVYKARDTRLDRIVAIKISHQRFSERFEREARVVAALNHPNICQLYDVGPDFLVMEFVEGVAIQPVDTPRRLLDQLFTDRSLEERLASSRCPCEGPPRHRKVASRLSGRRVRTCRVP